MKTLGYGVEFDHEEFWEWCRKMVRIGHKVFVSEYRAPDDFVSVFKKEILNNFSNKKTTEKLFVHESQLTFLVVGSNL